MHVTFLKSAFHESQYPPPDRPEIAFAGRSNVGKSSLINTLVKRKHLARTSSKPGRTQSINFFNVDNRLYLVDLPGYGYARVPIGVKKSWELMVETYLRTRLTLKAVVVIVTGHGDDPLALEAMSLGPLFLIRKPFRVSDITEVLNAVVRVRR